LRNGVIRLENVTNVGRICVKILKIDTRILRNNKGNTVRNLGNNKVTAAMTSEIAEVIGVKI
jgi:hypothetical protein